MVTAIGDEEGITAVERGVIDTSEKALAAPFDGPPRPSEPYGVARGYSASSKLPQSFQEPS